MGLDQSINVYFNEDGRTTIASFRKVNWLHNWMHQMHCSKYGKIDSHDYNCIETELSREDLLKLQTDVITGNVQAVSGFFFGSQEIYEEDKEHLLNVIAKCLLYSARNQRVTYDSWW